VLLVVRKLVALFGVSQGSGESLVRSESLENALNILEESVAMAERLADCSRRQEHEHAARRFEERAQDARQQATVIWQVLIEGAAVVPDAS
jgi:hypothetical protein